MSNEPISLAQIWMHTTCVRCRKQINKGEPRAIIMLAELGIGPGHREYEEALEYGNDDAGLLGNNHAIAMCRPCAGEDPQILIANPWFEEREEACVQETGGSVRATLISQLRIPHGDLDSDPLPEDGPRSAARNESEDRFVSMHAEGPIQPRLTQDDLRYRMQRLLSTAESRKMRAMTRKVLELWADGKTQIEIAATTEISQATVSRIIRDGKGLLYSRAAITG